MAPANQRLRRMVVVSHLTPFMPLMRGCTHARNVAELTRVYGAEIERYRAMAKAINLQSQ